MSSFMDLECHVGNSLGKCYLLPVATACNAHCVFCATLQYQPSVTREFMDVDSLAVVAATLVRAGASRFEITGGGEPTLHRRLAELTHRLRGAGADKIKLYTNGVRLPNGLDLDQLNISRTSLNDDTNARIMRFSGANPALVEIVKSAREMGYDNIRLSVPLVTGGVDSPEVLRSTVVAAIDLFDSIVFRPLYPATPDREALLPVISAKDWMSAVEAIAAEFLGFAVEFDSDGCFRAEQTILAADLVVYGDWSLNSVIYR